jgi:folate-binding protein YgfZ
VITGNISSPTARSSGGIYAAFLNAQGRVLNDVFIYAESGADADGWLIEVDAQEAERLAKHIKRYKLRAKFDVRLLEEGERNVWSVWRDEGMAGSNAASVEGEGRVGCEDARAPGMGRRLVLEAGRKPEEDGVECDEGVYRVRRYLKGVPEGQSELIREAALPQESNVDFMGGIDYRKGCYVGQELTIRTHHTGVVRKRILPVMLYGKDEPIPSVLEYLPEKAFGVEDIPKETSIGRFEKRGRSAGKWLAGVGNIGLALCRLEIMTDIQVQGEAGGYKEGDEFKLEWQVDGGDPEMAKVKAFVPPWHLAKQ